MNNFRGFRLKGTDFSVAADGEGVPAAGNDGDDVLGLEGLDAVGPVLLFPVAHPQLPILA